MADVNILWCIDCCIWGWKLGVEAAWIVWRVNTKYGMKGEMSEYVMYLFWFL